MFKKVLKLVMISMMFTIFACSEEDNGDNKPKELIDGVTIFYENIAYKNSISNPPIISSTATHLSLLPAHFDWSITAGNDPELASIDPTTGIITVTDINSPANGDIEITATFNNSYEGAILEDPAVTTFTTTVLIEGLLIPWDGITSVPITEKAGGIFEIDNGSHLAWIALPDTLTRHNNFKGKTLKFRKNINMNEKTFTGIENFEGKIEGNHKMILTLMIHRPDSDRAGLIWAGYW